MAPYSYGSAVKQDVDPPQLEALPIKFVKMLSAFSMYLNTDTMVTLNHSLIGPLSL